MKIKKNKYKEKDIILRRKEWDKTRREVNNKKWMLRYDQITRKHQKYSPAMTTRNTFCFFILLFFPKKVIS